MAHAVSDFGKFLSLPFGGGGDTPAPTPPPAPPSASDPKVGQAENDTTEEMGAHGEAANILGGGYAMSSPATIARNVLLGA